MIVNVLKEIWGSRDIKFRLQADFKLYQPIHEIVLLYFLPIRECNLNFKVVFRVIPPSLLSPEDNLFLKQLVHRCRITDGTVNNLKFIVSFFPLS